MLHCEVAAQLAGNVGRGKPRASRAEAARASLCGRETGASTTSWLIASSTIGFADREWETGTPGTGILEVFMGRSPGVPVAVVPIRILTSRGG